MQSGFQRLKKSLHYLRDSPLSLHATVPPAVLRSAFAEHAAKGDQAEQPSQ